MILSILITVSAFITIVIAIYNFLNTDFKEITEEEIVFTHQLIELRLNENNIESITILKHKGKPYNSIVNTKKHQFEISKEMVSEIKMISFAIRNNIKIIEKETFSGLERKTIN